MRTSTRRLGIFVGLLLVAGAAVQAVDGANTARGRAVIGRNAPEFAGIDHWLNGPPLTMQALRGKVVLVDFWTYGCINCFHTLPHVEAWDKQYGEKGLTVIGVHTPEF